MCSDKIRVLVLDDAPTFTDVDTGLITFTAGSGLYGWQTYDRNFDLAWLYDLKQAKEYAARLRVCKLSAAEALLDQARYPHLLLYDYSMDRSQLTARNLRTLGGIEMYRERLDPLAGNWGTQFEWLGRPHKEVMRELDKELTREDHQYGGCFAGLDITSLLNEYAHVGVPQTVHRSPPATAALEWHLSPHLGPLLECKTGMLTRWFDFFAKALPEFRTKLLLGTATGALSPCISDLLPLMDPKLTRVDVSNTIRFRSRLGEEQFRLEAIFFDHWYRPSDEGLTERDPTHLMTEIQGWIQGMLNNATGKNQLNDVRAALETATKFIAAHVDPLRHFRRGLSLNLARAKSLEEMERAVREHGVALAKSFDLDPAMVLQTLREGKVGSLEIPDTATLRCGVLDSVKAETPTPESGRYAALALLVWGEMAWLVSTEHNLNLCLQEVERFCVRISMLRREVDKRLRTLSGVVVRDQQVDRFLSDLAKPTDMADSKATLRKRVKLFRTLLDHHDFDDDRSQSTEAKANFMRDIFAPAPKRLLMWRESGADVDKPLARLGDKEGALRLSITAVLDCKIKGGLRPGEGALIRLFAAEFGFAERHWPHWMREAVHARGFDEADAI